MTITTLMYHYVRDEGYAKYPVLNYYSVNKFRRDFEIFENGRIDLLNWRSIRDGDLSHDNRQVLLTFDDGYKEHYELVAPILNSKGAHGIFFVPASPILQSTVLLPNKIHVCLAYHRNPERLYVNLCAFLRSIYDSTKLAELRLLYLTRGRFDGEKVNFIKRVLQRGMPTSSSHEFLDHWALGEGLNWRDVNASLYMTTSDLKDLLKRGHLIGLHGNAHYFYEDLSREDQEKDIHAAIDFVSELGVAYEDLMVGYPYGSYNEDTLDILSHVGVKKGFIDNQENITRGFESLTLPRVDCNFLSSGIF